MVSSTVRLSQTIPTPQVGLVRDSDFSGVGVLSVQAGGGQKTGDYVRTHLPAITYPKAVAGQEGWATEDDDDWSDSPVLDPLRHENKRWSYGRGPDSSTPGVYGRLSDYSGLLIYQRLYLTDADYNIRDDLIINEGTVRHLPGNSIGTVLIQEPERISGEVTVSQFPFALLANPVPFSYKNAVDTDVSIRLSNYAFPLSSGTITLSLERESKTLNITEFGTGLGGFDAIWLNDQVFNYNQIVDVEWVFFDTAVPPNELTISYWFSTIKDYVGPRITNLSPADNTVAVSKDTCIEFTIRDFEVGVNSSSLQLYVNNVLISGVDITITEVASLDGYVFSYCPSSSFLYGDEIPVSVYIEDLSSEVNYLFHVYSFTIEPSLAPSLVGQNPNFCEKQVPTNTDVEFTVVDGGHGIDKKSIEMGVAEESQDPRLLPVIYREE